MLFAEVVEAPQTASRAPDFISTSAGNVLVHFLGSLRTENEAVVPTQLDLDASDEPIRTLVGTIDLSKATEEGAKVTVEVGHSQTLVGKVVKLKQPVALLRPEQLKSGRIEAELVHYEIYFGSQPLPRVSKRPLDG